MMDSAPGSGERPAQGQCPKPEREKGPGQEVREWGGRPGAGASSLGRVRISGEMTALFGRGFQQPEGRHSLCPRAGAGLGEGGTVAGVPASQA